MELRSRATEPDHIVVCERLEKLTQKVDELKEDRYKLYQRIEAINDETMRAVQDMEDSIRFL